MPYTQLHKNIVFDIGQVVSTKRGQKLATITVNGGTPLWQLTSFDKPLYCPFGAGVFQAKGGETRLNLDVRIEGELLTIFNALDEQLENKLKGNTGTYHKMVNDDGEYGARVRMKVNTNGLNAAGFFSLDHEALGRVDNVNTRGASIIPVVMFTKAWFMGGMYGVTIELRMAVIHTQAGEQEFDWPDESTTASDF